MPCVDETGTGEVIALGTQPASDLTYAIAHIDMRVADSDRTLLAPRTPSASITQQPTRD